MEVNYIAVVVASLLAMVIGGVWYGPLFGRKWMEINNLSPDDVGKREEMQKSATPLYGIQLLLTLLQVYILAHFVNAWTDASGVETALFIWLGFIVPTVAGAAMWNMQPTKVKWAQFLITAGYQLVCFMIFGFVLGMWR